QNMSDDYYRFDDRQMILIGERTGKQFRIGDVVEVRVLAVKPEEHAIDFEVVGMVPNVRRSRKETPTVIQTGRGKGQGGQRGGQKKKSSTDKRDKRYEKPKKKFYEGVAKKSKNRSKKRK